MTTPFLWDFGDGNTSTDQNPTHQYTVPGSYDVKMYYYGQLAYDQPNLIDAQVLNFISANLNGATGQFWTAQGQLDTVFEPIPQIANNVSYTWDGETFTGSGSNTAVFSAFNPITRGYLELDVTANPGTAFQPTVSLSNGAAQAYRLTTGTVYPPDLVALWHGEDLTDSGPNSLNWTSGDGGVSTNNARFGDKSFFFNQTYLELAQNQNLHFHAADFTIEAWVNYNTGMNAFGGILGSASQSPRVYFGVSGTGNNLFFGGDTMPDFSTNNGSVSQGVWHHVAACRNGSTIRLFVDGKVRGLNTTLTGASIADFSKDGTLLGTCSVGFGLTPPVREQQAFRGYIDEVRVCNTAKYVADFTVPEVPFNLINLELVKDDNGSVTTVANTELIFEPPPADPLFDKVLFLMHCEGVPGTQTYTDSSQYARVPVGNSGTLVESVTVFAGSGALFMSTGVNFNIPGRFAREWMGYGTDGNPITYEVALNTGPNFNGNAIIFGPTMIAGGAFQFQTISLAGLGDSGVSASAVRMSYSGGSWDVILANKPLANTWFSLAVAFKGTGFPVMGVWINGIWQGEVTASTAFVSNATNIDVDINLGRQGGSGQYIGYIDEIRISNSLHLPWGSNYTQTIPFPNADPVRKVAVIDNGTTCKFKIDDVEVSSAASVLEEWPPGNLFTLSVASNAGETIHEANIKVTP